MLSESDLSRLGRALEIARTSDCRFPMGAVLVKGGNIQGVGVNRRRNDPRFVVHTSCSVHAEVAAMRNVSDPRRSIVYVARVSALGAPALARPCDECFAAMYEAGVKRVVWTTNDDEIGYSKIKDIWKGNE